MESWRRKADEGVVIKNSFGAMSNCRDIPEMSSRQFYIQVWSLEERSALEI